jgi:predicted DNA-binding protein (MmcQ/YjbR family)
MERAFLQNHCLQKKGVTLEYPFGPDAMVFKVVGKMFVLIPTGDPLQISLKCEPAWAEVLRQTYSAVTPGYHLNKRHWNTIVLDGSIPDDEIIEMVDHAYERVVRGLTRKARDKLKE